jgi:hypothetical protein
MLYNTYVNDVLSMTLVAERFLVVPSIFDRYFGVMFYWSMLTYLQKDFGLFFIVAWFVAIKTYLCFEN